MKSLIAVLALATAAFAAHPLPFLFAFGQNLSLPAGLVLCADSGIAVTDPGKNCVFKYSFSGALIAETGGASSGALGLNTPSGITRRRGFDLFVSDERNSRLVQYDNNLCLLSSLRLSSKKSQTPFYPAAIAAGNDGTLFVCDRLNNAIMRVEKDNSVTPFLKTYRDLNGAPLVPCAIAVAGNAICVADAAAGAIFVFDRFGTLVRSFTTDHSIPAGGLAACGDTAIVAADARQRSLTIYSIQGAKGAEYSIENASGNCVPGAICCGFGRWYIVDTQGKRICVFSIP